MRDGLLLVDKHPNCTSHDVVQRVRRLLGQRKVGHCGTLDPGATGLRRIAWYDSDEPLVSGWAWGQENLEGGTSMLEADIGDGKLFLFGPKITFRSQSHGTFPLLFNGIYYGSAAKNRPVS